MRPPSSCRRPRTTPDGVAAAVGRAGVSAPNDQPLATRPACHPVARWFSVRSPEDWMGGPQDPRADSGFPCESTSGAKRHGSGVERVPIRLPTARSAATGARSDRVRVPNRPVFGAKARVFVAVFRAKARVRALGYGRVRRNGVIARFSMGGIAGRGDMRPAMTQAKAWPAACRRRSRQRESR